MTALLLLALVGTFSGGEVRGTVVAGPGLFELAGARVEANLQGAVTVSIAVTGAGGTYRIGGLPPGAYDLRITAPGFYRALVREVRVEGQGSVVVPSVRIEVAPVADCGAARRPDFFRVRGGLGGTGAVAGIVQNEGGRPIAGVPVRLFRKGQGVMARQTTGADGGFLFSEVKPGPEELWVSIEGPGFFAEEVQALWALPGLEADYVPIVLEACLPGRCHAHLKTLKVWGHCE